MSEYCDFKKQIGTGSGGIIDMLINMPEGLKIIVDAKASLKAFEKANKVEQESGSEAADAIWKEHAAALRDQVKELSKRNTMKQYKARLILWSCSSLETSFYRLR